MSVYKDIKEGDSTSFWGRRAPLDEADCEDVPIHTQTECCHQPMVFYTGWGFDAPESLTCRRCAKEIEWDDIKQEFIKVMPPTCFDCF